MHFCHSKGFIHRDLKPDNVLLTDHDEVKLCDFGVSRLTDSGDGLGANPSAMTMTCGVGTPVFMAVEMITGDGDTRREMSNKVDVFSFGVMLWTMWTRQMP